MSLLNKVNFLKGWPSPSVSELVLPPPTGVTVEQGFVGHRDLADPEKWALGVSSEDQIPFIFRNGSDDPDSARTSTAPTSYVQVPFGGIQGIGFDNALQIETTQYSGTPEKGDFLYAHTDGLLKIGEGSADVASKVLICQVVKAPYYVGNHHYIQIVPLAKVRTSAS